MPTTLSGVINTILDLIYPLLLLLMSLSTLIFFKGIASFIFNAGDMKAVDEGKQFMKWGLIALFVMFSLTAILRFFYGDLFGGTFGLPLFKMH